MSYISRQSPSCLKERGRGTLILIWTDSVIPHIHVQHRDVDRYWPPTGPSTSLGGGWLLSTLRATILSLLSCAYRSVRTHLYQYLPIFVCFSFCVYLLHDFIPSLWSENYCEDTKDYLAGCFGHQHLRSIFDSVCMFSDVIVLPILSYFSGVCTVIEFMYLQFMIRFWSLALHFIKYIINTVIMKDDDRLIFTNQEWHSRYFMAEMRLQQYRIQSVRSSSE